MKDSGDECLMHSCPSVCMLAKLINFGEPLASSRFGDGHQSIESRQRGERAGRVEGRKEGRNAWLRRSCNELEINEGMDLGNWINGLRRRRKREGGGKARLGFTKDGWMVGYGILLAEVHRPLGGGRAGRTRTNGCSFHCDCNASR
jgi:hypothetical protein